MSRAVDRSVAGGSGDDVDHHDTRLRKSQQAPTIEPMSTSIDRIREVIATSGMNQGEFAQAMGLDAPKLSKSLAGTRRFTSLDIARIAEVGGVSVDWLLGGAEPILLTAARRAAGTSSEVATAAASRLVELRDVANALGRVRTFPEISGTSPSGPDRAVGRWFADEALRLVAERGFSQIGLDLASVIETFFKFDVAVVDLGAGFDGLSVHADNVRMILAAPTANLARQRFTMAHELGHLLMGDDQAVHLDQDIYSPSLKAIPSEVRANAFAAAFLMPAATLAERVRPGFDEPSFAALAMDCLVSPSALAIRLGGLRLIDQLAVERYRRMTVEKAAARAGRSAELGNWAQLGVTARVPSLLAEDLFAAYTAGETTLRPYARLLGVDPSELRQSLRHEGD